MFFYNFIKPITNIKITYIDWQPTLNSIHYNNNINNLFYFRNICKEWFDIIKDITFQYKIKFKCKDKIKYLKNVYPNILIHCDCSYSNITNDDLYYFIEIYSLDIFCSQNKHIFY